MEKAKIREDIPGLDEALLASDYAEITGRDESDIITDVRIRVILGTRHNGRWYVEAPPYYQAALDLLNARRATREHGTGNSTADAPTPSAVSDHVRFGRILGLKGKVTREDLRKAYREAIAKYHPDRVHGLGQELQDLAHQKSKEINQAYEYFNNKYKN